MRKLHTLVGPVHFGPPHCSSPVTRSPRGRLTVTTGPFRHLEPFYVLIVRLVRKVGDVFPLITPSVASVADQSLIRVPNFKKNLWLPTSLFNFISTVLWGKEKFFRCFKVKHCVVASSLWDPRCIITVSSFSSAPLLGPIDLEASAEKKKTPDPSVNRGSGSPSPLHHLFSLLA